MLSPATIDMVNSQELIGYFSTASTCPAISLNYFPTHTPTEFLAICRFYALRTAARVSLAVNFSNVVTMRYVIGAHIVASTLSDAFRVEFSIPMCLA